MKTRSIQVLSVMWLGLIVAYMAGSERRDVGAGATGHTPAEWPVTSTLRRATAGPTLVMLAHPRCPCTVASLEELQRLLVDAPGPPRAYVLMVRPAGAGADFEQGDALERARALQGAHVVVDVDGREAERFGARTSGHVVAYDAAGRLCFTGGLTPARGRRGESAGRRALLAVLQRSPAARAGGAPGPDAPPAPVFGCPLVEEVACEPAR